MGNQWTKVSNKTNADFYVVTFNDADLINGYENLVSIVVANALNIPIAFW